MRALKILLIAIGLMTLAGCKSKFDYDVACYTKVVQFCGTGNVRYADSLITCVGHCIDIEKANR